MAITWTDTRPDDFRVMDVVKDPTNAGEPSQVYVILQFTNLGVDLGPLMRLTVGPGAIQQWVDEGWVTVPPTYDPAEHDDLPWSEYKFLQLWDAVPDVPQATLDTIKANLPVELMKETWKRRS